MIILHSRLISRAAVMDRTKFIFATIVISCCLLIASKQLNKSNVHTGGVSWVDNSSKRSGVKYIFEDRHLKTKNRCTGSSFRVVSYNIMADFHSKSTQIRDFDSPYCPPEYLDVNYRKKLILKELKGYNGDIFFLQEVDDFIFENELKPTLSREGFDGVYAAPSDGKFGVTLFYRRERFRLIKRQDITYIEVIKEERNQDLWQKINTNSKFTERFMSKSHCLLTAILQSVDDESKYLLLGSLHLNAPWTGGPIRNIQIEIVLRELQRIREDFLRGQKTGIELSTVIAGDFNSLPYSAVVQLLTLGYIQSNHVDWYMRGKAEFLPDVHLTNPIKFESACGYPNYTWVASGFFEQLDYIFIEPERIFVERVIPPPDHKDVIKYTALPSIASPSDHIAQVVDLSWRKVK